MWSLSFTSWKLLTPALTCLALQRVLLKQSFLGPCWTACPLFPDQSAISYNARYYQPNNLAMLQKGCFLGALVSFNNIANYFRWYVLKQTTTRSITFYISTKYIQDHKYYNFSGKDEQLSALTTNNLTCEGKIRFYLCISKVFQVTNITDMFGSTASSIPTWSDIKTYKDIVSISHLMLLFILHKEPPQSLHHVPPRFQVTTHQLTKLLLEFVGHHLTIFFLAFLPSRVWQGCEFRNYWHCKWYMGFGCSNVVHTNKHMHHDSFINVFYGIFGACF